MVTRGYWLTVEGIDGAGRTTLLNALTDRLSENGITVTRLSRYLIADLAHLRQQLVAADAVDQRQAAVLAAADALLGYRQLIAPALAAGNWVITDASVCTHRVHFQQRGVPRRELDALFRPIPLPDQVFYLHTPVSEALKRGRAFGRLDMWTTGLDATGISIGQAWAQRTSFSQNHMETAFQSWQAQAQALFPGVLPPDRSTQLIGTESTENLVDAIWSIMNSL